MVSKSRNRLLLGVILIAIIISVVGITRELKVKKALEFTSQDVVTTWLKDKAVSTNIHDKIIPQDLQSISEEVSNNQLRVISKKTAPASPEEEITILLNGKKIDETSYIYETKIYLAKLNNKETYMNIEIFDIKDDTMEKDIDRSYTIDSYKLANTIDRLYN